jgi:O-antigen ligase
VGFGVVLRAHNIYLQILQAGGLVGFVGFYWFIIGFISLGWKIRPNARFRTRNPLIIDALIVSIFTWLLIGLFFNLIFDRFLYIPMGLLFGIKGILNKDQYCFS